MTEFLFREDWDRHKDKASPLRREKTTMASTAGVAALATGPRCPVIDGQAFCAELSDGKPCFARLWRTAFKGGSTSSYRSSTTSPNPQGGCSGVSITSAWQVLPWRSSGPCRGQQHRPVSGPRWTGLGRGGTEKGPWGTNIQRLGARTWLDGQCLVMSRSGRRCDFGLVVGQPVVQPPSPTLPPPESASPLASAGQWRGRTGTALLCTSTAAAGSTTGARPTKARGKKAKERVQVDRERCLAILQMRALTFQLEFRGEAGDSPSGLPVGPWPA